MAINFDCGCSFIASKSNDLVNIDLDVDLIKFDCSRTWELISSGNTKGCFQLESRLGQVMSEKLGPNNIEELAALISIMRPGCLEAVRDGKNVSTHFIDKKNGKESVDYFHPSLEPVLKNTYGEMIYQEQSMEIARIIAGFNLVEADMLRKAIGKKKPEEMAKVKKKFLDGCNKHNIVNENEAEEIFGWIEKSQRYSFNKSHAVSYAINGYFSAYAKAHFPKIFFLSYLRLAKDKIDPHKEILELITNAKDMDIDVFGPSLKIKNKEFEIVDNKIYFGLTNIKGVGDSVFIKLIDILNSIDLETSTWPQVLFKVMFNTNSAAAKSLISCGALDYLKISRNKMLLEFNLSSNLTAKEQEKCLSIIDNNPSIKIEDLLRILISEHKVNKNRQIKIISIINEISDPSYSIKDNPEWIADNEKSLLGVSITCSKTDTYDASYANTDCKDLKNFPNNKQFFVVAEIDDMSVIVTKKGKNPGQEMCFLRLSDSYGSIDSVVLFPEEFESNKELLEEGRVLLFSGQKSGKNNTPIVKKCFIV
jgi:DNA polymerase-3 subunit alpha